MTSPDAELRTLRLYGALCALGPAWAGKLIFAAGPGVAASSIAPAASIAGSTSLIVEADANSMKAAHRQGHFDFVVTTLDEALRTLKNEIRQGRPLAIGLIADESAVLTEAAERGLLPDLCMALPETPAELLDQLHALRSPQLTLRADTSSAALDSFLQLHGWHELQLTPEQRVLSRSEPETDAPRERWRTGAPLYLRGARIGINWVWR